MRSFLPLSLLVVAFSCPIPAQPMDGDLIVAANRQHPGGTSELLAWNASKQSWSTLFQHTTRNDTFYCVRMGSDDSSLVVGLNQKNMWPSNLVSVDVFTGKGTTVATTPTGWIASFELDHDGWIVGGAYGPTSSNHVWLLPHASPSPAVFSTLVTFPMATGSNVLLDVTIDRDPLHSTLGPYVLAIQDTRLNTLVPRILRADRNGVVTTVLATSVPQSVSSLNVLNAVEVDPVSGKYLTCDFRGFVCRVEADGSSWTTLGYLPPAFGQLFDDARFTQGGLAWIALSGNPHLFQMDMKGTVITMMAISPLSSTDCVKGLEIYGSRRLVCQQNARGVTIRLKSLRPGDAGKPYVLACSFNRRPPPPLSCLRFPGGDYLFLDYTDPLFVLTANNLLPTICQNFQGTTDSKGAATARVNVWNRNLNLTIFVAGVILNPPSGFTITNTHWFVL
jgi:hypothetical protein